MRHVASCYLTYVAVDAAGRPVGEGEQTAIGGNERYVALCRRHFMARLREG